MTITASAELDLLLHKLASDDAFRAQLMRNPAAALDSIGVELAPQDIPASIILPSKQAIAKDRLALLDKLENSAGAIPFFLTGKD